MRHYDLDARLDHMRGDDDYENVPKCPSCGVYQDHAEPIHAEDCPVASATQVAGEPT